MKFGYFDDALREYVITRPDTPLPWINYLGCEEYFGIISNTAGGYSFYKDARLRRLTRYRYNNAPLDSGGRYIYIRDDEHQAHQPGPSFWSPSWQPTRHPLDEYECRHGLGYTTIRSKLAGIESQTRYFVPLGESLEIWELTLTNHRDRPANLSVFSAVEFCLWDGLDDGTNFQRNYSVGEVEVVDDVIYHKTEYRERRDHFAYFACSEPLTGFDTQREAFLGAYRGWDSPAAVEAGQTSGSIAYGWQPIGAQHVKIHLEAGEQKKIIFILGYRENPRNEKFDPPNSQIINKRTVKPVIARYLQAEEVETEFQKLRDYWDSLLEKLQVKTPDLHTNRMVNIWNIYQVMITFNMSRSASYFESGIGRGMGFRDSAQDLLGFVHLIPKRARERILDLAATQLESGGAYHQYQPLTKRGNNDVGSGFNDDPLWLVLSVAAYIKETGDWSILDERVPYDNRAGTEETLYGHLLRSTKYTVDRLGPHGLPLIGRADWNDCLNLNCFSDTPGQSFQTTMNKEGKIAESVFIAGLFVLAAQELAEIAENRRRWDDEAEVLEAAKKMEQAVWAAGWDGEWFRRAYDDFGRVLGSNENEEGKIFIEPQGICVMAGLGTKDGRARQALDSVAERLATKHGIVLLQPAFSKYYLHLGEISSYPPGYKENAGIFCHNNPWVMIAEARIGNGDRAHDYYLRINPSVREEISEVHKCEPYVYSQMIAGCDAPTHGEAKNSWLTGTAAWNYVAITQWILGIRATFYGLQVAPVIPSAWSGFEIVRNYRGVRYEIQIERKGPGNKIQLEVNGKPIDGTVIPIPSNGTKDVKVVGEALLMQFGYFDDDQREYIITDPRTPVKWINYIGTREFGGFVDHTGGALICKGDPTFNRITKYIQQMPSSDFKGEALYLRLHTANDYRTFSPFFVPTLDLPDPFECRIGLGYTRIISEFNGLRTDVTIFVPLGGTCEIRDIKINNISGAPLTVDVIPLVEYTHPDALRQFTNADWVPQTMQSRVIADGELTMLVQYPFMFHATKVNYFTSNIPASSFETDRKKFLGENEYGCFRDPLSLHQPELNNSQAQRGDNIAALLHPLGIIQPDEKRRVITQLGQDSGIDAALANIRKYRQPEAVESALAEIRDFWDKYLSAFQIETPDKSMNTMLNIHNPHQCYVTKTWSCYLSYYQLGLGSRGIGIRDSSQDVLSVLAAVPEEGRDFIRTLLSFQKRDGSAMHQFNPLTMEGSAGDSLEMEDRPHYYSDDHLWVVLATTAYLKETGDWAFLEEMLPFYEKDRRGKSIETGTVLEHLRRSLAFTCKDVGQHGLPLLGFADWNDTVNLPAGAESLFTANLYGKALAEMIALVEYLGDSSSADKYRADFDEMRSRVESVGWDGEWYVRYFDAEGNPLGSSKNQYGQIYLNGQSWPVISGFASQERSRQAMDSVYRKLNTKYGIKLSAPGFNGYDPQVGGVTTYPPGAKENGGIFLHPNPWAIIVETLLGNGDRAYEYYAQINPAGKNNMIELYECEPYVYAQNILGDEHPQFGLGRNSWLSGTASWCYQAATQWILGIRPEYNGLRVDPCIPSAWNGFSAARRFRGRMMRIVVHNPHNVSKGVVGMTVDGKTIEGNLVPLNLEGVEHKVEVRMGTY